MKEVPAVPVDTSPMRWKGTEKEVPKAKVNDMVKDPGICTNRQTDRQTLEQGTEKEVPKAKVNDMVKAYEQTDMTDRQTDRQTDRNW